MEQASLYTENIKLKQLSTELYLRISRNYSPTTTPSHASLLAISSKHAFIVAATENGLLYAKTTSVRKTARTGKNSCIPLPQQETTLLNLKQQPSHLRLSADNTTVFVVLQNGAINLYRAKQLDDAIGNSLDVQPAKQICLGKNILDIRPNPHDRPELFAVLFEDATVSLVNTDGTVLITFSSDPVTSICWSPKGKQISCGLKSGKVEQRDTQGTLKNSFAKPESLADKDVIVRNILWVENTVFLVAYTVPLDHNAEDPDHDVALFVVTTDKARGIVYRDLVDYPAGPYGARTREAFYYLEYIRKWDHINHLVFVANSPSNDVGLIGNDENGWATWIPKDETDCITLPLPTNSEDQETENFPVGLALDLSANEPLPPLNMAESAEPADPVPVLMVLTGDGVLACYNVMNIAAMEKRIKCDEMVSNPTELPDDAETRKIAPPSPAFSAQMSSSSAQASIFSAKSSNSSAQTSVFSAQPSAFASVPPPTQKFCAVSSTNTTSSPLTALPTSAQLPSFGKPSASGTGISVFGATSTFGSAKSTGFSFASPSSSEKEAMPTLGLFAPPSATVTETQEIATPFSTAPTVKKSVSGAPPTTVAKPPPTMFAQPPPTTASQTPPTMFGQPPPTTAIQPPSAKAAQPPRAKVAQPQPQPTTAVHPSPTTTAHRIAQEFENTYREFQAELNALKSNVRASEELVSRLAVSSKRELSRPRSWTMGDLRAIETRAQEETEAARLFFQKAEAANRQAQTVSEELVTACSKEEEIKSYLEALKSEKLQLGIKARKLGPEQAQCQMRLRAKFELVGKSLEELQEQIHHVQQENAARASGRRGNLKAPSLDTIYRTMKNITATAKGKGADLEHVEEQVRRLAITQKSRVASAGPLASRRLQPPQQEEFEDRGTEIFAVRKKFLRRVSEALRDGIHTAPLNESMARPYQRTENRAGPVQLLFETASAQPSGRDVVIAGAVEPTLASSPLRKQESAPPPPALKQPALALFASKEEPIAGLFASVTKAKAESSEQSAFGLFAPRAGSPAPKQPVASLFANLTPTKAESTEQPALELCAPRAGSPATKEPVAGLFANVTPPMREMTEEVEETSDAEVKGESDSDSESRSDEKVEIVLGPGRCGNVPHDDEVEEKEDKEFDDYEKLDEEYEDLGEEENEEAPQGENAEESDNGEVVEEGDVEEDDDDDSKRRRRMTPSPTNFASGSFLSKPKPVDALSAFAGATTSGKSAFAGGFGTVKSTASAFSGESKPFSFALPAAAPKPSISGFSFALPAGEKVSSTFGLPTATSGTHEQSASKTTGSPFAAPVLQPSSGFGFGNPAVSSKKEGPVQIEEPDSDQGKVPEETREEEKEKEDEGEKEEGTNEKSIPSTTTDAKDGEERGDSPFEIVESGGPAARDGSPEPEASAKEESEETREEWDVTGETATSQAGGDGQEREEKGERIESFVADQGEPQIEPSSEDRGEGEDAEAEGEEEAEAVREEAEAVGEEEAETVGEGQLEESDSQAAADEESRDVDEPSRSQIEEFAREESLEDDRLEEVEEAEVEPTSTTTTTADGNTFSICTPTTSTGVSFGGMFGTPTATSAFSGFGTQTSSFLTSPPENNQGMDEGEGSKDEAMSDDDAGVAANVAPSFGGFGLGGPGTTQGKTSIYGTAFSTPSAFGSSVSGFGAAGTSQAPSFGTTSAAGSTGFGSGVLAPPTGFGKSLTSTNASPSFGTSTPANSGFGNSVLAPPTGFGKSLASTPSAFGSSQPSGNSAFGGGGGGFSGGFGSSGGGGFGNSTGFGTPAPAVAFGRPSALGSSTFGQTSALGTGTSAFGQTSALGTGTSSAFGGSGSVFGRPSAMGTSSTGFGQSGSTFGSAANAGGMSFSSLANNTTGTTAFGGSGTSAFAGFADPNRSQGFGSFGAAAGAGGFQANSSSSAFGGGSGGSGFPKNSSAFTGSRG